MAPLVSSSPIIHQCIQIAQPLRWGKIRSPPKMKSLKPWKSLKAFGLINIHGTYVTLAYLYQCNTITNENILPLRGLDEQMDGIKHQHITVIARQTQHCKVGFPMTAHKHWHLPRSLLQRFCTARGSILPKTSWWSTGSLCWQGFLGLLSIS